MSRGYSWFGLLLVVEFLAWLGAVWLAFGEEYPLLEGPLYSWFQDDAEKALGLTLLAAMCLPAVPFFVGLIAAATDLRTRRGMAVGLGSLVTAFQLVMLLTLIADAAGRSD